MKTIYDTTEKRKHVYYSGTHIAIKLISNSYARNEYRVEHIDGPRLCDSALLNICDGYSPEEESHHFGGVVRQDRTNENSYLVDVYID